MKKASDGLLPCVSFIPEKRIENFTWTLLTQLYPHGVPVPIPVEDIAERHYNLCLGFEELDREILGYCDFGKKTIWINSFLLNAGNEERLRFTVAHELGHYSCHSHYMGEEDLLFSKSFEFYKSNHSRLETQANIFAGYILIPTPLALREWIRIAGSESPYSREDERRRNEEARIELRKTHPSSLFLGDDRSLRFTREMAETFETSFQCAEIQLQKIKLLI